MRNSRPVTVRVDGKRWRRVLTLTASGSADFHFVVETKPNGSTTVLFGDGIHGASPSKALKVDVTFGSGAGAIRIGLRRSRTTGSKTRDQALWSSIRNRTSAIVFGGCANAPIPAD
jgi:hypothetical protein